MNLRELQHPNGINVAKGQIIFGPLASGKITLRDTILVLYKTECYRFRFLWC